MPVRRVVLIVAATELALFLATRLIVGYWSPWEWQAELLRSAARLAAAAVFWHCFRNIIFAAVARPARIVDPAALAAICAFLSVPLLVGDWHSMGAITKIVFAATGLIVAVHEEFLFRGLVQNLFERRFGIAIAIAATGATAAVWHLPALPLNAFNYLQVFIASGIIGLIYARTRSMGIAIALHALYDAMWSLTPVLREPLAWYWGVAVLVLALTLAYVWARREAG